MLETLGGCRIELDKIYRFTNFGIGLQKRFSTVGQRSSHQLASLLSDLLSNLAQDRASLGNRFRSPTVRVGFGTRNRLFDILGVGLTVPRNDNARARRVKAIALSPLRRNFLAGNFQPNLSRIARMLRLPLINDSLGPLHILRQ